jgi:class 3 adenylate cyclase
MFSDVAGSTAIYDTLGDAAAEKCIADCINMMARVVKSHSGQVVKTIGDEVMARFNDPNEAYMAAKQIQAQSSNIKIDDFKSAQMRIGMHTGPVIEKDNDIFGDAVNIAARMTGIATAGQIIISEDMFSLLEKGNQGSARFFDRTQVKGKDRPMAVYQVVWEEQNHTSIITAHEGASIAASKGGMILVYNGQGSFISNNDGTKAFSVGRDASCDLMVNSDYASRNHLDIAWKRDKFILTDHSTNGTTVTPESGNSIFLKREPYPLIGKGSFMLGVDGKHVITYDVLANEQ